MTAALRKIVEEVTSLTSAEQQALRVQLDSMAPLAQSSLAEEEYRRQLLTSGLISRIPPSHPASSFQARPIPVQGKPVSETILEDRR